VTADLTADLFDKHTGTEFDVAGTPLTLVSVERAREQPGAPREQPFSLWFSGPAGTQAEQGTYELEHAELGRLTLFLVPRQPLADGLPRYEAIFN
jgi:hypothetical protein